MRHGTERPTIFLATGNRGKVWEFGRLLGGSLDIRPMPDTIVLPEETGRTFAENARAKAEWVFAALEGAEAVLADDSGLEVEALDGRPGVQSARYAGVDATDEANVTKLLQDLARCSDRRARFVCRLCLILPGPGADQEGPEVIEVEGRSSGRIMDAPQGTGGFGYDPVFLPEGWAITLAQASPEEKDQVSHRGAAARALLDVLRDRRLVGHAS
ncbi:MAG: RdgB/HAM1 family non-canonical purine NTP pyrophosphatase [Actinobacteria bacterium]|nr:RdgB/HAM1 family non-canonical purine NTP pyrophosphatase [Actinomycetota bacterium]